MGGRVQVVVTDYPEKELIVNVHENIEANTTAAERENVVNIQVSSTCVYLYICVHRKRGEQHCCTASHVESWLLTRTAPHHRQGHLWGTSVEPLLAALADVGETKFDVVIMADLIFNHNQQTQLLQTARAALKDDGKVPRP
jgi:predicted nicotinamide N-methyase